MIRLYSLATRVHRASLPGFDEAHEQFLQAVGLVAHAHDSQAGSRQRVEKPVHALVALDVHLENTGLAQTHRVSVQVGDPCQFLVQAQHECFQLQLAQDPAHPVVLDNAPVVDDGHVAAETLGFLEVVGGEDDRRAFLVDRPQKLPHGAANLDVHARGRLIENQEPGFMHKRPGDHQTALHPAGQIAGDVVAPIPELQLAEIPFGPLHGNGTAETVIAGLGNDDIQDLLELVEIDLLGHEPDAGFGRLQVAVNVMAENGNRPPGLGYQRRDDSDSRRLARAVGPQQGEKVSLGNVQVQALQSLDAVWIDLA